DPEAGHFAIRPAAPFTSEQRYERSTNVLVTEFTTSRGVVRLRDFMPYIVGRRSAVAEIFRRVEGVRGQVEMEVDFAPRFGYGLVRPALERSDYGVMARDERGHTLALATDVPLTLEDDRAAGRFTIEAGDELYLVADW